VQALATAGTAGIAFSPDQKAIRCAKRRHDQRYRCRKRQYRVILGNRCQAGVISVAVDGSFLSYRLVYAGGGTAQVSGPDGADQLTGIERVQFDNGTFAVPTASLMLPRRRAMRSGRRQRPAAGRDRIATRAWRPM